MTPKDKEEFRAYLRNCTDAQVQGVFDKEHAAGREEYAELAKDEGYRRNIQIDPHDTVDLSYKARTR